MKRILLILAAVVAAVFAGRALYRASVSDETRIRWVVDDMCEGFAATRMKPILAGLAPEFLDDTYGADRALVQGALAQLFFEQRDSADRRFPYRVEWRSSGPLVDGSAAGPDKRATMELDLEFFRREGEAERSVWTAKVQAQLVERDGDWRFVRTSTTTVAGRRIR